MSKEKYNFELRLSYTTTLQSRFNGTFQEARQRGDRIASRMGRTRLYAYNEKLRRWEMLGTFLGHMRFVNKWGDQCIIKDDFSGIVEVRKEASNEQKNHL